MRYPFVLEANVDSVPGTMEIALEQNCYGKLEDKLKWERCTGCERCKEGVKLTREGEALLEWMKRWQG